MKSNYNKQYKMTYSNSKGSITNCYLMYDNVIVLSLFPHLKKKVRKKRKDSTKVTLSEFIK